MSADILNIPIQFIKGVGESRALSLQNELKTYTYSDLLQYFPFRYVDRSKYHKIDELVSEAAHVQIIGKVVSYDSMGKGRNQRLKALFADETGSMELVWFKNVKWIKDSIKTNNTYIVFGKPKLFNGVFSIVHPEMELVNSKVVKQETPLTPVYNLTEKLKNKKITTKTIKTIQRNLLDTVKGKVPENIPDYILNSLKLISRNDAFEYIHFPIDAITLSKAKFRLKFEELLFLQLQMYGQKILKNYNMSGFLFSKIGDNFNSFYNNNLPFALTGAQKRVLKEIREDVKSGKQMNRLVQGDVGSGKTMVALMAMLMALDNDFQTCLIAPTEVLATQHYKSIVKFLNGININVKLLKGASKTKERRIIHEELQDGSLKILIGTHAILEDVVKFKNLGLTVIDEQHRFGVAQRAKLWKKNANPPHVLVMTATPIPRTLAMTLYGDLDVSVIDELPPGRKPIRTIHKYDSSRLRLFGFMKKQIEQGGQVYIVYPLIEESEKLDLKNLDDGYEAISRAFPKDKYQISVVHGKMKSEDKQFEMNRFLKKETQIMIATTVIEVGVDIPNANVMVIENAERFGMSQLHQLRGRVGRGQEKSYCVLMTSQKLSKDAKFRIDTMVRTNDGFEIAEADMKLRGPGDMQGTKQSGDLDLKIADITQDYEIIKLARNCAINILKEDPFVKMEKNIPLRNYLRSIKNSRINWSKIS